MLAGAARCLRRRALTTEMDLAFFLLRAQVFLLDDAWRLLIGPIVDIPAEARTFLPYAQATV